jgi:hypothetical protein
MEKKFRQTFEKMEGFSFVTPVTGLNRPNTGKEDDDDDDDDDQFQKRVWGFEKYFRLKRVPKVRNFKNTALA